MEAANVWNGASASVRVSALDAQVDMVEYSGTVDALSWRRFAEHHASLRRRPKGLIVRCDRAKMPLDQTTAASWAELMLPYFKAEVPGAIVVRPEQLQAFRAFAWALTQHGIVRHVTTEAEGACLWVSRLIQFSTGAFEMERCRLLPPAASREDAA